MYVIGIKMAIFTLYLQKSLRKNVQFFLNGYFPHFRRMTDEYPAFRQKDKGAENKSVGKNM